MRVDSAVEEEVKTSGPFVISPFKVVEPLTNSSLAVNFRGRVTFPFLSIVRALTVDVAKVVAEEVAR